MNRLFPEIKKNFGFGCMRLPMIGDGADAVVDNAEFSRMIDTFIEAGFNYFDTAHNYLGGKSERALRDCLTSRYPREAYGLTDKLASCVSKSPGRSSAFSKKEGESLSVRT